MHEHIEILMAALAARLRRDRRRTDRKNGPRRPRGTFVPVTRERRAAPAMRLAH